eukprot:GILJ01014825.1.p1 GENE.GILJ01014825.1~~GILJ01014825.1.p1  ORF type:complete len:244 (-),score=12.29 GILJ01014825.1:35-766(-)
MASERQCRICHETDGSLIRPCLCSGSIADVHESCLVGWIQVSGKLKCDICRQEVATMSTRNMKMKFILHSVYKNPWWFVCLLSTTFAVGWYHDTPFCCLWMGGQRLMTMTGRMVVCTVVGLIWLLVQIRYPSRDTVQSLVLCVRLGIFPWLVGRGLAKMVIVSFLASWLSDDVVIIPTLQTTGMVLVMLTKIKYIIVALAMLGGFTTTIWIPFQVAIAMENTIDTFRPPVTVLNSNSNSNHDE